ncbi:M64 family metallopeptidase [Streptomyces sp. BBFR2]|uniref:M64 family metallopeptidase n=1 Tax=Streptomyces sp. BBFR2 TaxID=3372854 RepID=UPI0037DA626B
MRRRASVRTSGAAPARRRGVPPGRRRTAPLRAVAAAGAAFAAALALTAAAPAGAAPAPAGTPTARPAQPVEFFTGPGGHPRHTTVPASAPLTPAARTAIAADGDVTPLVRNGPVADKLDVVFIGDGYTAGQQEDFHKAARAKWEKMTAVEPYASYTQLFNVWAVDAVSQDSGVSGDPTQDVVRDTALGSAFFCGDTERLLCVDTAKVEAYAAKAPAADLVVVLGHSSKYGGAGYNNVSSQVGYDGIATASSDHDQSDQIAVHETGHSLGKLADEYDYGQEGTYTGPEPTDANLSTLGADAMKSRQTKWYRWLGQESPDGGTVGTYEGGGYYEKGLNRPTDNSIMRTLGREFNLPGREAMIAGFHRHAKTLTSDVPTGRPLARSGALRVTALPGAVPHWYVDGREARAARGAATVRPAALGLPADGRTHTVTVRATDPTDAVRDPALRPLLTTALSWRVTG